MEFIDDFSNHNPLSNPTNGSSENGFASDDWLDMALGIAGPQDDWLLGLEGTDCSSFFSDEKHSKTTEKNGLGKGPLLRSAFSTGDLQSLQSSSSDYSPSWAQLNPSSRGRLESVPENCTTNGGPLSAYASAPMNHGTVEYPPTKPATSAPPSTSDPLESLSIEQLEQQLSLAQQETAASPIPNHFDPSANPFVEPLTMPFPGQPEPAQSSTTGAVAAPAASLPMMPQIKQSASSQDLAALNSTIQNNSPQSFISPPPGTADTSMLPPLPFMLQAHNHNNQPMHPQVLQMQFNTLLRPMVGPAGNTMPSLPSAAPQLQPPSLPTIIGPPQPRPQPGLPHTQPQQHPPHPPQPMQPAPASQPTQQLQPSHQQLPLPPGHPHAPHPMMLQPPLPPLSLPLPPGQAHQPLPDGQASSAMPAPPQPLPGFSQAMDMSCVSTPMDYTQGPQRPINLPIFPPLPQTHFPDLARQPTDPSHAAAIQHAMQQHQQHPHHTPFQQHHQQAQPTIPGLPNPLNPSSPPDSSLLSRPPGGGLRKCQSAVDLASWRSSSSLDLTDMNGAKAVVGKLTPEERAAKILRYRQKRNERNFNRTIKYQCRKTLADTRPRVRGRFARNNDPESVPPELTKKALREKAKGGPGSGMHGVVVKAESLDGVTVHAHAAAGHHSSSGCTATTSTDDSLELPSLSDPMAMLVDSAASSPFDYLGSASSAHAATSQPPMMPPPNIFPNFAQYITPPPNTT